MIAIPRLVKYKEVANDHQLQIIGKFSESGYLIGTQGVEGLEEALKQVENFAPKPYQSNTENMINLIRHHINA